MAVGQRPVDRPVPLADHPKKETLTMGKSISELADDAMAMISEGEGPWWAVELATTGHSEETRRKVRSLVLTQLPPEEETDEDP